MNRTSGMSTRGEAKISYGLTVWQESQYMGVTASQVERALDAVRRAQQAPLVMFGDPGDAELRRMAATLRRMLQRVT